MKLNEEQCAQLPFDVGGRVWYNVNVDSMRDCDAVGKESVEHGRAMEQKWGHLLGIAESTESAAAGGTKSHDHGVFTFNSGFVTSVYLNMNTAPPGILYQVTQLDVDDVQMSSPGKFVY